ncbi:MAG: hypothetical protein ACREVL_12495 [Solimonas sp.]
MPAFAARAGTAIADAGPWFEQAGGRRSPAEGFTRLLLSYGETAGIDRALARTAQRLREPAPLLQAGRDWQTRLPPIHRELPVLLDELTRSMHELAMNVGDQKLSSR